MNTTETLTPPGTVALPGFGFVPALPEALHPVATVAGEEIPAGTWGVAAWRDGDSSPSIVASGKQSPVWAARLGADLAKAWKTDRVWLVRRMPGAVTVHTLDYARSGNTLGTMLIEPAGHDAYPDAWEHVVQSLTGDPERDGLHHRRVFEAWRKAHGFGAHAKSVDVITAAGTDPLEPLEYHAAYVLLVFTKTV